VREPRSVLLGMFTRSLLVWALSSMCYIAVASMLVFATTKYFDAAGGARFADDEDEQEEDEERHVHDSLSSRIRGKIKDAEAKAKEDLDKEFEKAHAHIGKAHHKAHAHLEKAHSKAHAHIEKAHDHAHKASAHAKALHDKAKDHVNDHMSAMAQLGQLRTAQLTEFVIFCALGVFLIGMSANGIPLMMLAPQNFAVPFSLGTLFFFFSLQFLVGFKKFWISLLSVRRMPWFLVYVSSAVGTLFAAVSLVSFVLTALLAIVQLVSIVYFFASFVPGGQKLLNYLGARSAKATYIAGKAASDAVLSGRSPMSSPMSSPRSSPRGGIRRFGVGA